MIFYMTDFTSNHKVIAGSPRSFGVVIAIVLFIIGFYPIIDGDAIKIYPLLAGVIMLFIGMAFPKLLSTPNRLWFKFGLFLGGIVSPFVMAIVFFLTITPVGIIMRLLGTDVLRLRRSKNLSTYWIKRPNPIGPMKNQY